MIKIINKLRIEVQTFINYKQQTTCIISSKTSVKIFGLEHFYSRVTDELMS